MSTENPEEFIRKLIELSNSTSESTNPEERFNLGNNTRSAARGLSEEMQFLENSTAIGHYLFAAVELANSEDEPDKRIKRINKCLTKAIETLTEIIDSLTIVLNEIRADNEHTIDKLESVTARARLDNLPPEIPALLVAKNDRIEQIEEIVNSYKAMRETCSGFNEDISSLEHFANTEKKE